MLWDSQMKTLNISKKSVVVVHAIRRFLLKPSLTEEQIARFAVNQYKYPSLDVRPYFKRNYLYGEAMTHILGYVGRINDRDVERLKKRREIC